MTRVIAGSARGRRLRTPQGEATRPTSDRVREALFSVLGSLVGPLDGLRVLDLYAGSGAVGIEAASRGAQAVTAVEQDRRTAHLIEENAATAEVDVRVVRAAVGAMLAAGPSGSGETAYDVVFLDPPYPLAPEAVDADLAALDAHGWLADGAVVVVERSKRSPAPTWPERAAPDPPRAYGETVLHLASW